MSRHRGLHSRHQAPGTFGVVLGQVQLLLQLGIDRFADQAQAVKLSLSLLGPFWRLAHFGRSQQFQSAILFKIVYLCYTFSRDYAEDTSSAGS